MRGPHAKFPPGAAAALAVCAAFTLLCEIAPRGDSVTQAPRAMPVAVHQRFLTLDTASDELIAEATGQDPFSRVRIPDLAPAATPPTIANDTLRILGTVVDSLGGSFALCQLGSAAPVLLRAGQKIGDYELRSVDKAIVVFSASDGRRAERRVPRAGG